MKTITSIQALQNANRESKTISGTITIIRALWSKGYKQAFSEFGLSFADMEFKNIVALCQKNYAGEIYITKTRKVKNDAGEVMLDAKGKPQREEYNEVIGENKWTATKLYNILKQSLSE